MNKTGTIYRFKDIFFKARLTLLYCHKTLPTECFLYFSLTFGCLFVHLGNTVYCLSQCLFIRDSIEICHLNARLKVHHAGRERYYVMYFNTMVYNYRVTVKAFLYLISFSCEHMLVRFTQSLHFSRQMHRLNAL